MAAWRSNSLPRPPASRSPPSPRPRLEQGQIPSRCCCVAVVVTQQYNTVSKFLSSPKSRMEQGQIPRRCCSVAVVDIQQHNTVSKFFHPQCQDWSKVRSLVAVMLLLLLVKRTGLFQIPSIPTVKIGARSELQIPSCCCCYNQHNTVSKFLLSPRPRLDKVQSWRCSIQCCFTSIETVQTIWGGEPRTSTSTFTQLLSSEFKFKVALRPQRPYRLLGTGSLGRPPRLSQTS